MCVYVFVLWDVSYSYIFSYDILYKRNECKGWCCKYFVGVDDVYVDVEEDVYYSVFE